MDVNARADIAKESAITGKSRNSSIIDPTVCAIVTPQPVLHSKIFTGIKVAGVNVYTAVEIVLMDPLCPTITNFLRQQATSECQPRLIKPHAALVLA
jgi:hypothetical protein